jgi:nicotinic acid phosphoribosyltransferase
MLAAMGKIYRHFAGRVSISFGWGTNLTSALLLAV